MRTVRNIFGKQLCALENALTESITLIQRLSSNIKFMRKIIFFNGIKIILINLV